MQTSQLTIPNMNGKQMMPSPMMMGNVNGNGSGMVSGMPNIGSNSSAV